MSGEREVIDIADYQSLRRPSRLKPLANPNDRAITVLANRRREMAKGLSLYHIQNMANFLRSVPDDQFQATKKIQEDSVNELQGLPNTLIIKTANNSTRLDWQNKPYYYKILLSELKRRKIIT